MKLLLRSLVKYIVGIAMLGLMLFLPAGTFRYPNGWLFVILLSVPMLLMGIVMLFKAPKLLESRLDNKEKMGTQKFVVLGFAVVFLGTFVLSALDFRFDWSRVPPALVIVASVLFLIGYALYAEVSRENAYLSRTVEVQEGQKVIDTGLYRMVRHPMYFATLFMFLPLPLILGSFWGLIPVAFYLPLIIFRLLDEEKFLTESLEGYAEYKKKVKYRLIPFIF
jgi:protein-S-isoprenylcysteine O-methyltransferase Ste14